MKKITLMQLLVALVINEGCNSLTVDTPGDKDGTTTKRVLVFGGNGFLGAATVELLIQHGFDVTIVNRGNWYWDSRYRIKPFVRSIICDRTKHLADCSELINSLEGIRLQAVVDFSAYGPFEVQQAVSTLLDKNSSPGIYVYISSDSVYEVCPKSHDGSSVETDAVRPTDPDEKEAMSAIDSYGNRKLLGEEVLQNNVQNGGFPYVALRLPDVIGPRDSTYRWWIYQLWIRMNKYVDNSVSLPRFLNNYPLSLVFVDDVAKIILDITNMVTVDEQLSSIKNEAFNLAYKDTFTLNQIFDAIQENLGAERINYTFDDSQNAMYLFPSVKKGPIDITKAEEKLKWQPDSWEKAIQKTVKFYENVMKEPGYGSQRTQIMNIFAREIANDRKLFYTGIQELYGLDLNFHDIKDEL